jgi:hypothetical protein
MGLIFGDYANGEMRMWNRVFPEHIGRLEDAQEYLNRLTAEAAELIKEKLGGRPEWPHYLRFVNVGS